MKAQAVGQLMCPECHREVFAASFDGGTPYISNHDADGKPCPAGERSLRPDEFRVINPNLNQRLDEAMLVQV